MAKVAAITGAYRGLGAAISKLLAEQGYSLILGGRDKKLLDAFVGEIQQHAKYAGVVGMVMDVRNKQDCETFVNAAVEHFGRLDLLINNAGIWWKSSIDDIKEEDLQLMFETNLYGPIYCAQAAVMIMRKQGNGHILNIGSTAAVDYKSSHIAYGSSKAALVGFTGCLRTELQGTGVRVSVVSPGGMKTDLFRQYTDHVKDNFMKPEYVAEKILAHITNPDDEWHVVVRRPSAVS